MKRKKASRPGKSYLVYESRKVYQRLYTKSASHFTQTPSVWRAPMPKSCGEEEEEYGVLVARAGKKKAQCAEDVVVTMQNTGGKVWEKDMADVIPQLRQLKMSKRGKH
ncbi:hypothetical protein SERLA73DRAFT_174752 [Serpula lacrymans var. lacrymans S7.3]|uniref:Uncharacterized protein n=2 Tax=Serpula lacrymans var. lacrymans TaxID=341189 RepID=F8PKH8_SERL3|nr:uncharacterized protein SERLADRAFT_456398 [Serpula lacrymans var. lacrymans S7.9]EGO03312.1 hypothetical protein SERLA73DRAFT_174752 [Serpula lacrymans var. lacrymans S7.3]EGO29086.1 hypothetical protein SERLADRAFT_456398 [Serpula lacrymans var. lacrymans S7.9]